MKRLITGALGAYLLLPIGAVAQAQPAAVPPITLNSEPRFKIEALRFRAINEDGIDAWPLSDEIKVLIRVPAHKVETVTQEFSDVDGGETRGIPLDQSCILPIAGLSANTFNALRGDRGDAWSCSVGGAPGPFVFEVEMREVDYCPFIEECLWNSDLIGMYTVVYPLEELLALQVGQVVEESVKLGPCHEYNDPEGTVCNPWDAVYVFTWRLTRLPDAAPPVLTTPDLKVGAMK
jgi:hypothetical protein